MAVAARRVSELAEAGALRGSRHALILALLAATIAMGALPPAVAILVILRILS